MTFHHRDPATKSFDLAKAITNASVSWARFIAELDKCDVLCFNCHMKEHEGNRWIEEQAAIG